MLACQQSCDLTQDESLLLLTTHRHTCSQCDTANSYHIVNQAQIQEELGVSEVVCECVCEWLDTHRRLDTERVLHHT